MVGDFNDEANSSHTLLLTDKKVSRIFKAFANGSLANINISKTYLSKMVQLGGFLRRLLGPLLKTGLPLIEKLLEPLAKSVLISLGLTTVASARDAATQKTTTKKVGLGTAI